MLEMFNEVQQALFCYDISRASHHLVEIIDALLQVEQQLDAGHQEQFQAILKRVNLAMQNQDYLLIADLLEFEILPLISKLYQ